MDPVKTNCGKIIFSLSCQVGSMLPLARHCSATRSGGLRFQYSTSVFDRYFLFLYTETVFWTVLCTESG